MSRVFLPAALRKRLTEDELAAVALLEKLLPSDAEVNELLRVAMTCTKEELATATVIRCLAVHGGDVAAAREALCREANLAQVMRESVQ